MATLEEVYRAVLAFCPRTLVEEDSDGNIRLVLMKRLADDQSTLLDFTDTDDEEDS